MGLFTGIEKANPSEGGVYIVPGNYTVEVQKVKTGKTRANRNFFVVECKVLESDVALRPRGIDVSWMVMLDQDSALGNIKQFCATATGSEMEDIDEAGVEAVVGDDNPLKGTKLQIQATNIVTKAGRDFTKVRWFPFVGEKKAASGTAARAAA